MAARGTRPLLAALVTVVAVSGCSTAASPRDRPAPSAPRAQSQAVQAEVRIELGHCFVAPVLFDGERWDVPYRHQFGTGGGTPPDWRGTGLMVRLGRSRARYQDDGGAVLTFRPLHHRSVRKVETSLCD